MAGPVERLFTRLHVLMFRTSRGRLGARLGHVEQVLLTTRGRRSGKLRTTPVAGTPDNDGLIVVASNNGKAQNPAWYLNLVAEPRVSVERRGRRRPALARVLTGAEREDAWRKAVANNPGFAGYAQRTVREIPVIRLDPVAGDAPR